MRPARDSTQEGSFLAGVNGALLGNEDTIEELTLILGAHMAGLADLGAHEGDSGVVDTLEDELVLHGSGELDSDVAKHVDLLDVTATQEVLDLDALAVLGDDGVDGEMSVNQAHLVDEGLQGIIIIKLAAKETLGVPWRAPSTRRGNP